MANEEGNILEGVEQGRKEILAQGENVIAMMNHSFFAGEQTDINQHSEMKANLELAYRHLEDARMRLGKVFQAHDGGKSVYNK